MKASFDVALQTNHRVLCAAVLVAHGRRNALWSSLVPLRELPALFVRRRIGLHQPSLRAQRSNPLRQRNKCGLLRRCAPRNDGEGRNDADAVTRASLAPAAAATLLMSEPSSLVMQAAADPSFSGRSRGGLHRAPIRWADRPQRQRSFCTVVVRVGCGSEFDYDRYPWLNRFAPFPAPWGGG